jgi:hypothetical protein
VVEAHVVEIVFLEVSFPLHVLGGVQIDTLAVEAFEAAEQGPLLFYETLVLAVSHFTLEGGASLLGGWAHGPASGAAVQAS